MEDKLQQKAKGCIYHDRSISFPICYFYCGMGFVLLEGHLWRWIGVKDSSSSSGTAVFVFICSLAFEETVNDH